jgi:hypothetical protein
LVGDLGVDQLQGSDRDLAQRQLLVEVLAAHGVGLALQADLLGEAAALCRRATAAQPSASSYQHGGRHYVASQQCVPGRNAMMPSAPLLLSPDPATHEAVAPAAPW